MDTIAIIQDLDMIVSDLMMHHFRSQLEYNKMNNNDGDTLKIEKLENIIALMGETKGETKKKNKKDEFFGKIDNAVFAQKWKYLSQYHKNIKLKEYIESICKRENCDINNLEKLLLDNDKINKYVVYDNVIMKITEITALKYNSENTTWIIENVKKPKKV